MLITESGTGAPDNAPYLTNGAVGGLSAEVNIQLLTANLTFKGDAAASRTLTWGQQASNADQIAVDVPFANFKVNGSEVMAVVAVQTVTGVKTFNDQTIKLRNPGNTFSYTVAHSAITADRTITVPLLTANDTLALLAEAQTLTNKTLGTGTVFSVAPTINDGIKFTFNPSAATSGMNTGGHSADPTTLADWDIWGNDTDKKLRCRINGVTYDLAAGGGGGGAPVDATYLVTTANATLTAEVVVGTLTANLAIKGDNVAGRTITIGQQLTNADTVTIDVPAANCTLNGVAVVNISATQTLTNKTLSTGTSVTASISWGSGVKQTFAPNATTSGLNVGSVAGDPSTPANGDLWYDSTANELTARINGLNVSLGAAGGGGNTLDGAYDQGGAGAGRSITADTGAVAITVPIASNNRALDLTQNDTTNNPACLGLANAGTGSHITVTSANQDLRLSANGTGLISLDSSAKLTNQLELRFMELTANGTNYMAFKAAASMAANVTYTWPAADGSSGQMLSTNGSGVLSWANVASGWEQNTATGNGSITAYTLATAPIDNDGVMVFLDGISQKLGTDYTIASTTLTFTTAPANGVQIDIRSPIGGTVGAAHALLSSVHSDVVVATVVRGDLIVGNVTPNWARLALGAADFAPVSNGTDVLYRKIIGDITMYVNYPGGAWSDDGDANPTSNATGTVKEDRDTSARRNYLHMEDSSASLKTFTHIIEWMVPWGWRGYATTSCIIVNFRTETNLATDNKLDVVLRKTGGTLVGQKLAQVSSSANTWTTVTFNFADLTAPPAAGELMVIKLLCYSKSGNHVELGEITFAIGAN